MAINGVPRNLVRALGFLTESDISKLSDAVIFVPGAGAIGSAVIHALARVGVGNFIIADADNYDVVNIAAQSFCDATSIGRKKVDVAKERILAINPNANVEVFGLEWMDKYNLDYILSKTHVVVAGFDSLNAGIMLYREARDAGVPMVDFYYGMIPNVFKTMPGDPLPEERLDYPTRHYKWQLCEDLFIRKESILRVVGYSITASPSSINFMRAKELAEFLNQKTVPVWSPLVMTAASLMSYEAIFTLLKKKAKTDYHGYFLDPTSGKAITLYEENPETWNAFLSNVDMLRKLADAGEENHSGIVNFPPV